MGDWLSTASATNTLLIAIVMGLHQIGRGIDVVVDCLIDIRDSNPHWRDSERPGHS